MRLIDVITQVDEAGDLYMVFQFTDGNLAFECPIGSTSEETLDILTKFADKGREILEQQNRVLH